MSTLDKAYSRLDRLFILLENGTTSATRNAAAKQLGEVQKKHPHELNELLARLLKYIQHKEWDARLAAAEAVKAVVAEVPRWSLDHDNPPEEEDRIPQHLQGLKFSSFEVKHVLNRSQLLLSSAGTEFDSDDDEALDDKEKVAQARKRLEKSLGLAVGGNPIGVSSQELFGQFLQDEDLISHKDVKAEKMEIPPHPKGGISSAASRSEVLLPRTMLSNRERNRARRKDKVVSRQNSKEGYRKGEGSPPEKRRKTEKKTDGKDKNPAETAPKHEPAPESWNAWPFNWFTEELLTLLFSPKWEWRHGACLSLRNILNIHGAGAGVYRGDTPAENKASNGAWLEDTAIRVLYVMLLDRFSDFVSDQVVAPVRESCSQVIGVMSKNLQNTAVAHLVNILVQFTQANEWEVRHAGFLGIKYVLAVREDIHESLISQCLPSLLQGLCDDDGDVKSVSAEALIPVTKYLVCHKASRSETHPLFKVLCDSLLVLDELSASTQSILTLISKITTAMSAEDMRANMNIKQTLSRLWLFTRHSVLSVRKAALRTVEVFLQATDNLVQDFSESDSLLSLGVWNLFLCCILEADDKLQQMTLVVWRKFIGQIQRPVLCSLCQQFFSPMFAMATQPENVPYSENYTNENFNGGGVRTTEESLKYVGGNPRIWKNQKTENQETLDEIVMRTRENASRMIGVLCAFALKDPDDHTSSAAINAVTHQLMEALSSRIALHRVVGSAILSSWWELKISVPPVHLYSVLLGALSEDIYFNELSPMFITMQSEIKSAFLLASQTQGEPLPFALKPSYSVEDALSLCVEIKKRIPISNSQDLQSCHQCLLHIAEETQQMHHRLQRTVRIYVSHCLVAASRVSSSGDVFSISHVPKLNPIIRPLMDGLKKENNQAIRNTVSQALAYLMDVSSNRDPCPNTKLLNNLCRLLFADKAFCPDLSDPVGDFSDEILAHFGLSREGAVSCSNIMLLKRHVTLLSENAGRRKKALPVNGKDSPRSSELSTARMGAMGCVHFLCRYFNERIFDVLPQLWKTISHPHSLSEPTACEMNGSVDANLLNDKVLSLLVIEACALQLNEDIAKQKILALLPQLFQLTWNHYSAVRYVCSRCLAALAKRFPSEVMTLLVQQLLTGIDAQDDLYKRMGTVELIASIIESVQTAILPYTVLLVVPLLGRMSDQNLQVRLTANSSFASLVQYLPVESSIPDPPNVPRSLLEQKKENRRFLEQLLDSKSLEEYAVPIPISAKLRKYQEDGIKWLAFLNRYKLHGILCDDMGLGKTLQAICILASDHYHKKQKLDGKDLSRLRSLVISPPTLTGHWVDEIKKFCGIQHLNPLHYAGHPTERTKLQSELKHHNLVIASYEVVRNDVSFFNSFHWNYCILDEGHVIRNGKNKLSMCVKSIKCNHRLILTGTPIQNSVLELWSLFDFLMPGFLGSEQEFNYRYSKPILASRDAKSSSKEQEDGVMAMEALHKQVLPFMLRRMKQDVLPDLPPKIIQDYYCNLSPLQVLLYEDFSKTKAKKEVDMSITQADTEQSQTSRAKHTSHVFQALQYLQKVCNHPALVLTPCHPEYSRVTEELAKDKSTLHDMQHSCKLVALKQLLLDCGIGVGGESTIESVISQHRALIFCQHKSMLDIVESDLLRNHMKAVTFLRLDGSVPAKNRHVIVSKFNNDPSIDVLLLTTKVGGLGLNLTGADTVIFIEHDWNPMVDLQAMDRAHRIGQKRVVNVYRLITRSTLEEKILGLQRFKLNVANAIISADNSNLHSMDTSQVLNLFTIGKSHADERKKRSEEGTKRGLRALLDDIGELWDQNLYDKEYNLDNFMEHLISPAKKS